MAPEFLGKVLGCYSLCLNFAHIHLVKRVHRDDEQHKMTRSVTSDSMGNGAILCPAQHREVQVSPCTRGVPSGQDHRGELCEDAGDEDWSLHIIASLRPSSENASSTRLSKISKRRIANSGRSELWQFLQEESTGQETDKVRPSFPS